MKKTSEVWKALAKGFKMGSIRTLSDKRFRSYAYLQVDGVAKNGQNHVFFTLMLNFLPLKEGR